jgi:hypothetical protein
MNDRSGFRRNQIPEIMTTAATTKPTTSGTAIV